MIILEFIGALVILAVVSVGVGRIFSQLRWGESVNNDNKDAQKK